MMHLYIMLYMYWTPLDTNKYELMHTEELLAH